MTLVPFEFNDPTKGHFISPPKPLISLLQTSGNGQGCLYELLNRCKHGLCMWVCVRFFAVLSLKSN